MPVIIRSSMIDDDGSGTTGTVIDNAWKQELYTQIDAAAAPPWTDIPFNAANFAGDASGTWVVEPTDVQAFGYMMVGRLALLTVMINTSAVTGAPTSLNITLPGALFAARPVVNPVMIFDAAAWQFGTLQMTASSNILQVFRLAFVPFVAGTNNTYIQGQIMVPLF
jgi:hypothetical protein